MLSIDFHQTGMGKRLFLKDIPTISGSLEKIASELTRLNNNMEKMQELELEKKKKEKETF